mgnify:CR=1 FL=1
MQNITNMCWDMFEIPPGKKLYIFYKLTLFVRFSCNLVDQNYTRIADNAPADGKWN